MAKKPHEHFEASRAAENEFRRALKKVAKVSHHIVEAHIDGAKVEREPEMMAALKAYAKLIEPWARRQAAKMLAHVSKSNKAAYAKNSKTIGRELTLLAGRDVGRVAADLMTANVALIKSIPEKAGLRAQELAREAFFNGTRAEEIAKELPKNVSESTATLIARTEVARANASFNQARAMAAGSRQYRWHNSGDEAVRPAHRKYKGEKIQGHVFSWDQPPTLDDGTTGHPGTFPNCRCYAEPYFPEE